ncbi:hypothetical protein D9M71_735090 [compost metagenome]
MSPELDFGNTFCERVARDDMFPGRVAKSEKLRHVGGRHLRTALLPHQQRGRQESCSTTGCFTSPERSGDHWCVRGDSSGEGEAVYPSEADAVAKPRQ